MIAVFSISFVLTNKNNLLISQFAHLLILSYFCSLFNSTLNKYETSKHFYHCDLAPHTAKLYQKRSSQC